MLAIPKGKKHFVCTCATCNDAVYTDESELEAARMVMRQGAWMEMAKSGVAMTKWPWLCPKCKPKPSSGSMPSTPETK